MRPLLHLANRPGLRCHICAEIQRLLTMRYFLRKPSLVGLESRYDPNWRGASCLEPTCFSSSETDTTWANVAA